MRIRNIDQVQIIVLEIKSGVTLHSLSKSKQKRNAKFMPRRDGPYIMHPNSKIVDNI